MASTERFEYEKGNRIIVDNGSEIPYSGIITGCYYELGQNVYDYVDNFGNPRWCYEKQIIFKG
jgi:hypothetical protein